MATIENEYRGVSLKMNDVFVANDKNIPTPSKLDGLDDNDEMALRIIGCESIQDAGKMLKLPQVAIACSQVLYHRFYFSKSFVRHNWEHYAMACVFLSAKIEECCRRLRDVVNVFVHIRQLREQKILKCLTIPEYADLKPYIIKAERRILKELGFCVHGKHPHKLICIYLHILGQDQNKDLVQLSWNYMNDSLRTAVFCCYQPEIIACACIYLAAVHLQFPLGQNWFEIFGGDEDTIKAICIAILKLYSIKNVNVVALEVKLTNLKKIQVESRNQKMIGQDKKGEGQTNSNNNNSAEDSRGRKSEEDGVGKGGKDSEGRNKENRERSKERRKQKSHKRKSASPRAERRYRSRSPRPPRADRSPDRKTKNHSKRPSGKEYEEKRHRNRSHDSGEEQQVAVVVARKSLAAPARTAPSGKEYKRQRSPSRRSSSSASGRDQPPQKNHPPQYRKRQRSSPSPAALNYAASKSSAKQSSGGQRRSQNGKMYR